MPRFQAFQSALETRHRTATDRDDECRGTLLIAALPPGKYSVTAELSGFGNVVRPEITVNVGATVDLNFQLGLASVAETVTVTGEAPFVESTKTSVSTVVTTRSARGPADQKS